MLVFPVIHHLDRETSTEQALLIRKLGAGGVFFISHAGEDDQVLTVATDVKVFAPEFKVGINLLASSALFACEKAKEASLDMVWVDAPGVRSDSISAPALALAEFVKQNPSIQLFASVAFKYQPEDIRPSLAAVKAKQLGFIPTTSGPATGVKPPMSKISQMSFATKALLAVASGMTPENIARFAPYISHAFVSTGISKDEYHVDPDRLIEFLNAARGVAQGAR